MSNSKSKSVKARCDEARFEIAELLPELVRCLGAKALGKGPNGEEKEPSLPHVKSLIDLAEYLEVEKKGKSSDEEEDEPRERHKSLRELLLEPLDDEDEEEDED